MYEHEAITKSAGWQITWMA